MDNPRRPHSEALPNFREAQIPPEKLVAYLLDPLHKEGQHKARVFKSALGFQQSNANELEKAILAELPYHAALLVSEGQWGAKYQVGLPITGPTGVSVEVLTIWIIRKNTDFPKFVTARVIRERRR